LWKTTLTDRIDYFFHGAGRCSWLISPPNNLHEPSRFAQRKVESVGVRVAARRKRVQLVTHEQNAESNSRRRATKRWVKQ
jgi:hypothetical protein